MEKLNIAIIGSGPAGLTAAIYSGRSLLQPLVFAGQEIGGQLMYTSELENFPGFEKPILGPKFMLSLQTQAKRFGTMIAYKTITAVDFSQRPFKLYTQLPAGVSFDQFKLANISQVKKIQEQVTQQFSPDYEAKAIIVATGAAAMHLEIPGEKEFYGKGVSVCAVCDAAFYQDKIVFVVGGGDSAMEDALALTKYTDKVTIIHRRDSFKASKIMIQKVLKHPHIKVLWNTQIKRIIGQEKVTGIEITSQDKMNELTADGVFLAIGHQPVTAIFTDQLKLDSHGFIITAQSPSHQGIVMAKKRLEQNVLVNFPTMTSVEGVFAAGDVVDLRYKQAITAAGMGAAAAIDAEKWLGN